MIFANPALSFENGNNKTTENFKEYVKTAAKLA